MDASRGMRSDKGYELSDEGSRELVYANTVTEGGGGIVIGKES